MTLKKNFKKYMSNPDKRAEIIYISSKRFFVWTVFIFFIVYFLFSASYYEEITGLLFLPLYVTLVLSFLLYLSSCIFKFFPSKIPKALKYVLAVIVILA